MKYIVDLIKSCIWLVFATFAGLSLGFLALASIAGLSLGFLALASIAGIGVAMGIALYHLTTGYPLSDFYWLMLMYLCLCLCVGGLMKLNTIRRLKKDKNDEYDG